MSSVAIQTDYSNFLNFIRGLDIAEYPQTASENNDSINTAELDELDKKAKEKLDNYLLFPYGWDGYNGERFESKLIEEMKGILSEITYFFKKEGLTPSEVTPGPASDGSVDLEIDFNNKSLILTKYPSENRISVYVEDAQMSREEVFLFEELNLESELYWLVS